MTVRTLELQIKILDFLRQEKIIFMLMEYGCCMLHISFFLIKWLLIPINRGRYVFYVLQDWEEKEWGKGGRKQWNSCSLNKNWNTVFAFRLEAVLYLPSSTTDSHRKSVCPQGRFGGYQNSRFSYDLPIWTVTEDNLVAYNILWSFPNLDLMWLVRQNHNQLVSNISSRMPRIRQNWT